MTELNPDILASPKSQALEQASFDYSFVSSVARIAIYDDLRSAPRIIEVQPASTAEYIEKLASTVYEQAKMAGGKIPYTAIREVSENFIHARFSEIVVSILDDGNTIRFADQGPGISDKKRAQLPGFSSAIEPMKSYIRGVGSGLPIVKEYLDLSQGSIAIDDNIGSGAVVTISMGKTQPRALSPNAASPHIQTSIPMPALSERERSFLKIFLSEGAVGVTEMANITENKPSTTYNTMKKLAEAGLIETIPGQKKRMLTDIGFGVAQAL